jgi:MtfA peptidase
VRLAARSRRREALLPADCAQFLSAESPLFARLPEALQRVVLDRLPRFVSRVPFVGCRGLIVEPAMRALIGVQACALTAALPPQTLDALYGVMLYPAEFIVEETDEDELTGVVTEGQRALSGQTLDTDRIVLSWQDVVDGLARADGYNVVVHEFAHYLDHASGGRFSGADPRFAAGYEALCDAVDRDVETLIDPYGAEEPAEFFAVLAEVFVDLPQDLEHEHPSLYAAMRDALQLDPARWQARGAP